MVAESASEVVIQFTGGKDSTSLAILMAKQFQKVHLLTFTHSLIRDKGLVAVNAEKLEGMFGADRFIRAEIAIEDLLRAIYHAHFVRDIIRYRGYGANNFCGACRLSMVSHTIMYCLEHRISYARDGSNRTGFDLSQQEWSLPIFKAFYAEFGIDFATPLYERERTDLDLLKAGLAAESPVIFHRSQPRCEGGGHFHNIFLRCHFLPLYGRDVFQRLAIRWLTEKLEICRDHIHARG